MITVYALVWCHTLGSLSHPAQACLSYGGQPTFSSVEECQAYAAPLKQRIAPRTPKNATLTVECMARGISGPKAKGAAAGAEQPSKPKVDSRVSHPGGLSGGAAIAKFESTSSSASALNPSLPAHAHPKQEKSTKAHNATQAAADASPPQPTEAPPPPAEPAAQLGNPLLRALRAAVESPPPPAKPPLPLPAEPAAQPGNSLLRALGDAFRSGGS
jgi:hypothetical protein